MRKKEDHGPSLGRGDQLTSDTLQILNEVRSEALAYGIILEFEMQLDGTPSKQAAGGTSQPQQAQEIICEILTKHYPSLCEALNAERRARGQKPIGDLAKVAKQKAKFEKAYYGKLRHSEKGRRVVDLLRAWRGGQITEQHGWCRRTDSARITWLKPFLEAVRTLDVEFFKLFAQAVQMLDTRIRSSSNTNIGTGDTYLDMWLLIYGVRIAGTPTHTAHDLNEQFVSKFRSISDARLRVKCNDLEVPLKDDARGTRAGRYKAPYSTSYAGKKH
jgi:hypothetical protein